MQTEVAPPPAVADGIVYRRVVDYVLRKEQFTVADLVEWTACNPVSVRSVVQRLKDKELLRAERQEAPADETKRGVGAPRNVYFLQATPAQIADLKAKLAESPLYPESRRFDLASNRDFLQLRQWLDIAAQPNCPEEEKTRLIEKIEAKLKLVSLLADQSDEDAEAALRFEQARLRYVRSDYAQAEASLHRLVEVYADKEDYVRRCNNYRLASQVRRLRTPAGTHLLEPEWRQLSVTPDLAVILEYIEEVAQAKVAEVKEEARESSARLVPA